MRDSATTLPGLCAKHVYITPTCRDNRGIIGAIDEALDRLRAEYLEIVQARGEDGSTYHLALTVATPAPTEEGQR